MKVEADGKEYGGFATDQNLARLSIKALMEALESLALDDGGLWGRQSRTGVAAHFTHESAQTAAYQELIERDAFMYHWLSERSGRSTVALTGETRTVFLESADPAVCVALTGAKDPRSGCWHLGLGNGRTECEAIEKSRGEWSASLYSHFLSNGCPGVSESSYSDFARHHLASQEPAVSALTDWILSGKSEQAVTRKASVVPSKQTQFRPLPCRSRRYAVVLAENKLLIPMVFGKAFDDIADEYRRNMRLREALPRKMRFHSKRSFLTHPFS